MHRHWEQIDRLDPLRMITMGGQIVQISGKLLRAAVDVNDTVW